MNQTSFGNILALASITGMRTMSGAAALAAARGGVPMGVMGLLAVGEMIADKTPGIGNRIDPAPLAARAVMGAVVGALVAREQDGHGITGALLGASTAVVAAHVAFHTRRRLPLPNLPAGLLEDAVVAAIGARYVSSAA